MGYISSVWVKSLELSPAKAKEGFDICPKLPHLLLKV